MRIALIAPPWIPVPPPAYGGTEAVLGTLARALVAAGHDVILAATGDRNRPSSRSALSAESTLRGARNVAAWRR